MRTKLLGTTNVDFDVTGQRLSDFPYPADTGEKWEYNGRVYQLITDFKNAYDSVMKEVLHKCSH
jgi:hypothetical protein